MKLFLAFLSCIIYGALLPASGSDTFTSGEIKVGTAKISYIAVFSDHQLERAALYEDKELGIGFRNKGGLNFLYLANVGFKLEARRQVFLIGARSAVVSDPIIGTPLGRAYASNTTPISSRM